MTTAPGSAKPQKWLPAMPHPGTESPPICVLTRFGLKSPLDLIPLYREYGRVLRSTRRSGTPGLLKSAFLVERPTACFGLSIWTEKEAIALFGTNVLAHVEAGNSVFRRLLVDDDGRAELWSTKWRLLGVTRP